VASRLLNVLHDIETERQRAVYNANKAGFDLHHDASVGELADCFLLTRPDYLSDDIDPASWHLPSELYDAKTILMNAGSIEKEGYTLYPYMILTFKNNSTEACLNTYVYGYTEPNAKDKIKMIRTSDGVDYSGNSYLTDVIRLSNSSSSYVTHTWGNVEQKYMIVYGTEYFDAAHNVGNAWNYKVAYCANDSSQLWQNAITQIILYNCQGDFRSSPYSIGSTPFETSLINLEDIACSNIGIAPRNLKSLQRISSEGTTSISSSGTPVNILNGMPELRYVNYPNLITLRGYNEDRSYTARTLPCDKLIYCNMPKLQTLIGGMFGNTIGGPISVNLPKLEYWHVAWGFYNTQYLKIGTCQLYTQWDPTNLTVYSSYYGEDMTFKMLKRFEYGANSEFTFLRFDNMVEYTFEEHCTLQGIAGASLNYIDLENVSLQKNTTTHDIYLGNASKCHTIIWPHALINDNLDITGFPNLSEDTMHELITHLDTVEETKYVKMAAQCYDKLSAEDIAIAEHEGWEVINNG